MDIRRAAGWVLMLAILAVSSLVAPAWARTERVVTLGADLTPAQRDQMLRLFGVRAGEVPILTVTNAEERRVLAGLAPPEQIGTRAISSALVELLPPGRGIVVERHNITWVTPEMYHAALVTAGVRDARVVAAAPFEVSGTAALTGIYKAYERASGRSLSSEAKRVSNQELIETGKLGEAIGKDKAVELVTIVKERVIRERVTDPAAIRDIIVRVAADLNITLTERQIDDLTGLMQRIASLRLNAGELSEQLRGLKDRLGIQDTDVRSFLQRLIDFFRVLIERIAALLGGG